jgi:hypothetical protein
MELAWTPRRQGDAGELSAINWLFSAGADVYLPVFTNPDVDLIADFGDRVDRVQVKTSTCWEKNRFVVTVCTRGGNQSWNVGDGRRWYIPATELGGGWSIRVGGPRYAAYEVEPGDPLQARPPPAELRR